MTQQRPLLCPICKQPIAANAKAYPFCSERCRLVDLGNWLDGRYAVGHDPDEPNQH